MENKIKISRHDLVFKLTPAALAVLFLGPLLTACKPSGQEIETTNMSLIAKLESDLGINPGMKNKQLEEILFQKTYPDQWGRASPLGRMAAIYNPELLLHTDFLGELIPTKGMRIYEEKYPDLLKQEIVSDYYSSDNEYYAFVYGSQATVDNIKRSFDETPDLWQKFLKEYFQGSRAKKNLLHLIYARTRMHPDIRFGKVDINAPDLVMDEGAAGAARIGRYTAEEIDQIDVLVNLSASHGLGLSLQTEENLSEAVIGGVIDIFANEKGNWVATQPSGSLDPKIILSEGPSTALGLLGHLSSTWRTRILGPNYLPVLEILVAEMMRIGKMDTFKTISQFSKKPLFTASIYQAAFTSRAAL